MNKDFKEQVPIDERIAIIDSWVGKFSETGEVDYIEGGILQEVLENFGADFYDRGDKERFKRLSSLSKFSNAGKGPGMRAVWGKDIFGKESKYNSWADDWAREYMEKTGKRLPKLKQKSKTKKNPDGSPVILEYYNSGMVAFIGDITAYAAGRTDFGIMKTRLEARLHNGKIFQEEQSIKGVEEKYKKVFMVDVYEKDRETIVEPKDTRPSSFPPEFPRAAWEYIKGK